MIELISLETIILIAGTGLAALIVGVVIGALAAGRSNKAARRRHEIERIKDQERQRLRTVSELIANLTSTLSYQRVLETALDLSTESLGGSGGPAAHLISAVLLFSENSSQKPELQVGSARGLSRADMSFTLPGTSGLIAETSRPTRWPRRSRKAPLSSAIM